MTSSPCPNSFTCTCIPIFFYSTALATSKNFASASRNSHAAVAMTIMEIFSVRCIFVNAAHKYDVKPIIGLRTLHLQKRRSQHRAHSPDGDTYNHLLVLAQNEEGYRNLVKITSEASLHGFYYKPRVSKNFLAEHSRGLIGFRDA